MDESVCLESLVLWALVDQYSGQWLFLISAVPAFRCVSKRPALAYFTVFDLCRQQWYGHLGGRP